MKFKSQQLIGIALGLFPLSAYSQIPYYRSQTIQNVTFALTITSEQAALSPRDENGKVIVGEDLVWENYYSIKYPTKSVSTWEEGSKMVPLRFSNKDILDYLVYEGVIDSPSGYSISVIQDTEVESSGAKTYEDEDGEPVFCLTKKDTEPVDISEYISMYRQREFEAEVETGSKKIVRTIMGDRESWTANGRSNGKNLAQIEFNFPMRGLMGYVAGVVSWSDTLKSFGSGLDRFYVNMPNCAKLDHVIGIAYEEYYDYDRSYSQGDIIEGCIFMGAGSLYSLPVPTSAPN